MLLVDAFVVFSLKIWWMLLLFIDVVSFYDGYG